MSAQRTFRIIGHLEGASFLILLFVAMPLKYLLAMPLAVRVVGSLHGLLFLAYLGSLARVAVEHHWPLRASLRAFVASLVPFGMFFLLPAEAHAEGPPAEADGPSAETLNRSRRRRHR